MSAQPYIIDCEQGSSVWLAARRGIVTASRCADVVAMLKKGGEAAARKNYRSELMCEILTGLTTERFVSRDMEWGTANEPFARAAYELEQDVMVETVGFVLHPDIPKFGCSPDGFLGDEGLVECKCPATSTHLGWVLEGKVPLEHAPQMLAEMACTGRKWVDFCSYDPRLPAHLQLFVKRFERDEKFIAALEEEVVRFNAELEEMLAKLPQGGPQAVVGILDAVNEDEMEF